MKKIVLTGGGTGGHIIPHLSLLPKLEKEFDEIIYIGSEKGLEKEIISKHKNIKFENICVVKLERGAFFKNFALPFKLLKSIRQAKKILKKHKPDVIFSKGGYVSVPVCIAGSSLKIPVISHESDLSLGLANKIIYKFCNKFLTSFEKTAENLKKGVYTGSPIRESIFKGNSEKGYALTNVDKTRPTLLVMGGSTGAKKLNEELFLGLEKLLKTYNVIHIVGKGKGDASIKHKNYCQLEYCHNIEDIFAITDLVLSRAGSNAIYEFLALKKPMLLVPLPKDASRGDQIENAKYFESLGYSETLFQEQITSELLIEKINALYKNKDIYIKNMQKATNSNGTENIFNEIMKLV